MNQHISKILRRVARVTTPKNKSQKSENRLIKKEWNNTPRNKRGAARKIFENILNHEKEING